MLCNLEKLDTLHTIIQLHMKIVVCFIIKNYVFIVVFKVMLYTFFQKNVISNTKTI